MATDGTCNSLLPSHTADWDFKLWNKEVVKVEKGVHGMFSHKLGGGHDSFTNEKKWPREANWFVRITQLSKCRVGGGEYWKGWWGGLGEEGLAP